MVEINIVNLQKNCKKRFVLSACMYTFQGYSLLLEEQGVVASRILFEGGSVSKYCIEEVILDKNAEIIVFFPKDVISILDTLKKIALLLNMLPDERSVVLYGKIPGFWLCCTLNNLVNDKKKLSKLIVSSTCYFEEHFKKNKEIHDYNDLSLNSKSTALTCKGNLKYLTKREIDILLYHFRGVKVNEQCKRLGLSNKTIYTHRKNALQKLQMIFSYPTQYKPSRIKNDPKMVGYDCALTNREMEIYNALLKGEIFPVYQVITNSKMQVVGFEVLLRWNQNGKIIKPMLFLRDINNLNVWIEITALVTYAAVSCINRYNGKFYYSVNIPPQLASGSTLPKMAKKAIEMLLRPQWANKLVFEFAETIDVIKNPEVPETMKKLRSTGCRLFLDDCLSNHQVMFPVRQVRFDGFKLDKDIIDQFETNDNDCNLIKTIQFYCDMTGKDCVAEGVDSKKKFDELVALGIKNFQGHYLAEAVRREELDSIVKSFYK